MPCPWDCNAVKTVLITSVSRKEYTMIDWKSEYLTGSFGVKQHDSLPLVCMYDVYYSYGNVPVMVFFFLDHIHMVTKKNHESYSFADRRFHVLHLIINIVFR